MHPVPKSENLRCGGLDVRRFCELIDPSCPQYDSRYRGVIVQEARTPWRRQTRCLRLNPHRALWEPSMTRGGTSRRFAADCCGGVPPGIFDGPGFDDSSRSPAGR